MDKGARRAYERTVSHTANSLVAVFNETINENKVNKEFEELMVSMGSARSLEKIFDHIALPKTLKALVNLELFLFLSYLNLLRNI